MNRAAPDFVQLSAAVALRSRRDENGGFTLVELLISMVIGMILLAGVSTLILQQSRGRTELAKSSRQIENGRYAMELIHDDIKHAGFYGEYSPPASTTYVVDGATAPVALGSCADSATAPTNLGWVTGSSPTMPIPIFGYARETTGAPTPTAPPEPACLTNRKPGTGILVVRRVSTASYTAVSVAGNASLTTYLQVSTCDTDPATQPFVFGQTNYIALQKGCSVRAPMRKYIVRIYYISLCNVPASGTTCTTAADGGNPIPTLKMVEFVDGTQTVVPLVEGIEDIQFDFGVDSPGGDGSPDSYKSATTDAATTLTDSEWANVVAVRVTLLARNTEPTTGYSDAKTYTLGGAGVVNPCLNEPFATRTTGVNTANTTAQIAACRAYPRHLYSEVTRADNISGRRDTP